MSGKKEKFHYVYIIFCTQKCSEYRQPSFEQNYINFKHKNELRYNKTKQCGFCYKIGMTYNLSARFSIIQSACPFKLKLFFWAKFKDIDSAKDAEGEMLLKYKEKRVRGEWFFFANINGTPQKLRSVKNFLTRLYNVIETSE